jgi:glyoxylase I family protein
MNKPYLHHVLVAAEDIDRSRAFYRDVLELEEIDRPIFDYPGIWFRIGDNGHQLHILIRPDAMLRTGRTNDPYDVHFAMRVGSYRETIDWLQAKGFRQDVPDSDLKHVAVRPDSVTGYPQIYILDPDRNIIEFNCETLD